MPSAITATISGRVQMVMFRDFCRRVATRLSLMGQVENKADGTVFVYAEGEESNLQKFIEFLQKGSMLSKVDTVAYQWVHPKGGYNSFDIHYT